MVRSLFYVKKEENVLRSIKQAYEIIRQEDPDTAISVYTIRLWCKEKKIKFLTVGTKILVDMESLMDYIKMKD